MWALAWRPTESFSINFVRRQSLFLGLRRVLAYVAMGHLALQAALALYLVAGILSAFGQSQSLEWNLKKEAPGPLGALAGEMDHLQKHAELNLAQLDRVVSDRQGQFPLAGKLAALAKTLPARTWIMSLSGDSGKWGFTVQARYLIDPANPDSASTDAWLQALKSDPVFSHRLKHLGAEPLLRGKQGKAEYLDFKLNASWQGP